MPLHIPDGYFHIKLRWALNGDPEEMCSTIGVRPNSEDDRDVVDVAHAVHGAWAGAFEPTTLNNQYTFTGVDAVKGAATGDGQVGSWDERVPGEATAASPPSNCCVLVRKKTALGGRKNSGRMFLPAGYLGEPDTSALGELSSVALNFLAGWLTQFLVNLNDPVPTPGQPETNFNPVLFHNDAAMEPTLLSSLTPDRIIATQRQRMRR